ncbi:MAG: hypothetical protein F9K47_05370 [Burkholderiales bacterium]|nr:MAG: hypothetical protein F9K47_05370 [Burkholderiales bacterium]
MPVPPFAHRLAWLIICFVLGLVVGLLGHRWSGEEAWYLALPGAVVLGWLYFGRPDACTACAEAPASRKTSEHDSPLIK